MDQMEPIVIEKNVPIPLKRHRNHSSESKYSFLHFGLVNAIYVAQKMTAPAGNWTNVQKKFTMRTLHLEDTTKGLNRVMRIWRTQ